MPGQPGEPGPPGHPTHGVSCAGSVLICCRHTKTKLHLHTTPVQFHLIYHDSIEDYCVVFCCLSVVLIFSVI